MRTRLTVRRPGGPVDLVVTTDAAATVGDVADTLARAGMSAARVGAATIALPGAEGTSARTLPRSLPFVDAGVRPGSVVAVTAASELFVEPSPGLVIGDQTGSRVSNRADHPLDRAAEQPAGVVARLVVLSGPDAGTVAELAAGVSTIGRGPASDVRLTDRMVSKLHARLVVTDEVEIVDAGSSNGVVAADGRVDRLQLAPTDVVMLGESVLRVERVPRASASRRASAGGGTERVLVAAAPVGPRSSGSGGTVAFNRSPRVVPRYVERTVQAPKPPEPATPGRFPLIALVAPLLMGAAMYGATRSALSLVFVGLSPLIMIGTYVDKRIRDRQRTGTQSAQFRSALDQLAQDLDAGQTTEREVRAREEPSTGEAVAAALALDPVLWCRRPDDDSFLVLHVGTGAAASRTRVERPARGESDPALWSALEAVCDQHAEVADVPLLVPLRECGAFGAAGPVERVEPVARGLVAQLVSLHSPAELVITAVVGHTSAPRWDWLKWLPHTASAHSPLGGPHLASGPAAGLAVVLGLEEVVASRRARPTREATGRPAVGLPTVVLVVEDDTAVDRGRLVRLAEEGPAVGVHVLWCASDVARLPAACRTFVALDGVRAQLGVVADRSWRSVECTGLDAARADRLARHLSSVADAGAPVLDASDVPRAVAYLAVAGPELADDPAAVVDRWHETGSVLDRSVAPSAPRARRTQDASLRALVGVGAGGDFVLDLRAQGPHALVGGTTGAGKSEFLQAWVLGMALAHSPDRVTFLFVDYKGGAAFADCVDLPHCVGLVTDLSPHLVRRALTSLRAELRRREELLNAKKVKDLLSLERTGDPETPPALVVVVDEFAALVADVPEFVDGMIDIAQRGRSLGLHLVLATQRPAGVIKDNLRANTNLRVALRMADEHDSIDVLGVPLAAHFDPAIPGRGAVRTGPERVAMFQTGYVGGRTSGAPPRPTVELETLVVGPGELWALPPDGVDVAAARPDGPTDIARAVRTVAAAARAVRIPPPSRPWLPELAAVRSLAGLGTCTDDALAFGWVDVPARQAQEAVWFHPDDDGSMVVFGSSGSGKSTMLRTIAAAVGLADEGGPVHVYGIEAGAGGLAMVEVLPYVGSVVDAADDERVARLVRDLRARLDERASRWAAARAGTLAEYRVRAGRPDEVRILVLLDGLAGFRELYESDLARAQTYASFLRIVAEGRPLGIHVVMSAERPGALPTALAGSIQRRLVLRQAEDGAYVALDVPKDVLGPQSPPGRGVLAGTGDELQVAVPGGSADPAAQAEHLARIATRWTDRVAGRGDRSAPPVRRLPDRIPGDSLPPHVGGLPVLGVADDTLEPIGFEPVGAFLVAGMPGSGRSTALAWLGTALRRHGAGRRLCYIGSRRSPAHACSAWDDVALDPEAAAALAGSLHAALAVSPGGGLDLDADADAGAGAGIVLVIESLADHLGGLAEAPLTEAVRLARRNGHLVVAEAETSSWGSAWPLVTEVRGGRRGLVLQPDRPDGESLFRTPFPRVARTDFPPGRGLLVEAGRARRVQLPLVD